MRFLLALLLSLVPSAAFAQAVTPTPNPTPVAAWTAKPAKYAMNLPAVNYWTPGQLFIDQMRLSPGWSQWGATNPEPIALDADGLPTKFPTGANLLYTMILLEDGQTYQVTYTASGPANISINGCNITASTQGKFTCTFSGDTTKGTALLIHADGAFPTNIHVVRQDRAAAFAAGEKWAPDQLEQLKGFALLRAMDWTQTNGSQRTDMIIADTKGSYAPGVPVAAIVDLANKTGARPWVNFPSGITDDGARAVFAYVKANLKAGIAPIYEYSNEMWNDGFWQTQWAKTNTVKPGDNLYWLGYRTGQLAKIGRGYDARFVLMAQFGVAFRYPLIYAGYQASGALDTDVEAGGAADYKYAPVLTDPANPTGPALMDKGDPAPVLKFIEALLPQWAQYHQEMAAQVKPHGWKYWTYEGVNFHLDTFFFGDKRDALAGFYSKAQLLPHAADVISADTDAFQAAGGEIETAYNWSSPPGSAGFFGLVGTPTFGMMKARMAASTGTTAPAGGTSTTPTPAGGSTTPTKPAQTPKPSATSKNLDALAKRAQQLASDISAMAAEQK